MQTTLVVMTVKLLSIKLCSILILHVSPLTHVLIVFPIVLSVTCVYKNPTGTGPLTFYRKAQKLTKTNCLLPWTVVILCLLENKPYYNLDLSCLCLSVYYLLPGLWTDCHQTWQEVRQVGFCMTTSNSVYRLCTIISY